MKIANFKREFMPNQLPEEVFEQALYRTGEEVTPDQIRYDYQKQQMQAKAMGGGHYMPPPISAMS